MSIPRACFLQKIPYRKTGREAPPEVQPMPFAPHVVYYFYGKRPRGAKTQEMREDFVNGCTPFLSRRTLWGAVVVALGIDGAGVFGGLSPFLGAVQRLQPLCHLLCGLRRHPRAPGLCGGGHAVSLRAQRGAVCGRGASRRREAFCCWWWAWGSSVSCPPCICRYRRWCRPRRDWCSALSPCCSPAALPKGQTPPSSPGWPWPSCWSSSASWRW